MLAGVAGELEILRQMLGLEERVAGEMADRQLAFQQEPRAQ
jgi:hypothetical protein